MPDCHIQHCGYDVKKTSKFTIAVHSIVYLHHHKGKIYSGDALAENVCTNAVRIRMVMARLKKAGMTDILSDVFAELDALCHQRLRELTVGEIDRRLFEK